MTSIKGLSWRSTFEAILNKTEKIKKGHRVLIFSITILLLVGGFLYLVYIPKSDEINQVKQNIAKLKQDISRLKKMKRGLPKFKEKQIKIQKKFEKILELLPKEREIPDLLEQVSQLGVKSGLEMRHFKPEKEELQDIYVEIPVSIEVGGTYAEVALFFDRLKRMKRIVNVKAIRIIAKKELSAKMTLSSTQSETKFIVELIAKCTVRTYRLKNEADELKDKKKK